MKEKFKKSMIPITKMIAFIIIFIFVFTYLTYLMKPDEVSLRNINGYYGEKKNSLDMVYIGGSACFVYWAPLQAFEDEGIASYSYGAYVVQAELYKYLIKEALKTQDPELIVIDARAFQYRENRLPEEVHYRNFLTGMSFSLNKLEFINENVEKNIGQETLPYIFDIIKYHRSFFSDNINPNALSMMFHTYKNPLKGFYFVPEVAMLEEYDNKTDEEKKIAKESEDILLDLLDYIKTTDNDYLFVVSPYQETKEQRMQFNYIEDIITEAGYNFVDANLYYDEMNLDFEGDLYNFNHVNIYGAEKYTSFISDYIKENYDLPDRRDDSNYKEWYDLLDNWHEQVDMTKKTIDDKKKELLNE